MEEKENKEVVQANNSTYSLLYGKSDIDFDKMYVKGSEEKNTEVKKDPTNFSNDENHFSSNRDLKTGQDTREIQDIPLFYNQLKKICYAAGDCENPNFETIKHLSEYIQKIAGQIFSPDMMAKVACIYNQNLSKRVKFSKILKYLEKLFPLETCTYFSSVEMKKSLNIDENTQQPSNTLQETNNTQKEVTAPVSSAPQPPLKKRLYKNPVSQLESNLRLKKYDSVKKMRVQKVGFF